jgi:hypothetical protein
MIRIGGVLVVSALVLLPGLAAAQDTPPSIEERLRRIEKRQQETERRLEEKDARIRELESQLKAAAIVPADAATAATPAAAEVAAGAASTGGAAAGDSQPAPARPAEPVGRVGGTFESGKGFVLARTDWGELDFSAYTYARYLNQKGLDDTYTDASGNTRELDLRNDAQFQKTLLYFKGWFYDPAFRYLLYTWTTNTSQGQGAQVVVAGNLSYAFNDMFNVGVGTADYAFDRGQLSELAARRQPHDRRRFLPRLLHHGHLVSRQSRRGGRLPRHARQ